MTAGRLLEGLRTASDDEFESQLRRDLNVVPLSDAALGRMQAALVQALPVDLAATDTEVADTRTSSKFTVRHRPHARARWGRWVSLAAAASGAIAILTFSFVRPTVERESFGSLVRFHDGGLESERRLFGYRSLQAGDQVVVGATVRARGPALLALARGGSLRLAAGSEFRVVTASEVALLRGAIYVDKPAGLGDFARLHVVTHAGLVEHLGTEFEVRSDNQVVRVRVREGRVQLFGASDARVAEAGTELLAYAGGQIDKHRVATYGPEWAWTTALAPDIAVEGRSLVEFLQWATRELGLELQYADAAASATATRTVLHGTVSGQAPIDAITHVLASTSLFYDVNGGVLRLSTARR